MEPRDYDRYNRGEVEDVISVGDWIFTLIVLAIPFVNIVMYLGWAFTSSTNKNKQNFCRASLIIGAIAFLFRLLTL